MRLLDKKEVDIAKAKERRLEVDEGFKLASKVDGLRRLVAEEQAKFDKWRDAMISAIKAEIALWTEKRDTIESEAKHAEERKRAALEPIKERENAVELKEKDIAEQRERLAIDQAKLNQFAASIGEREGKLKDAENAITLSKNEADRLLETAIIEKKSSSASIRAASARLEKIEGERKAILEELKGREGRVAERERNASLREKAFAQREDALSRRERDIIDREETLAREIKRVLEN